MVASEASRPIRQQGTSQHQPSQGDNLSVVNNQNHRGTEDRHGDDPPHRLEEIVHNAHEQSAKIVSEFEEIVNGDDSQPSASKSDTVIRRVIKKRSAPVDRTSRNRILSRKKDILVERSTATPDLKEIIFLETVSKNAGVTNEG